VTETERQIKERGAGTTAKAIVRWARGAPAAGRELRERKLGTHPLDADIDDPP
jgi:hypothetical protein